MIDRAGGENSATFKHKDHAHNNDDGEEVEAEDDTNQK
jgi:hypothetical protein